MHSVTSAQHTFSQVPTADIQRSKFDRSHGRKATFNSGYLVPVYVDDVLPGDTFNLNMTAFTRLATPIYPFMDNLFMDSFFFFVPNRLVWTHWEKFNGAQDNPGDSTSFTVPTCTSPANGYANSSLQDYFGLPTAGTHGVTAGGTMTHSNLPLRAYNLIWNTWFRDQNLQNSVTVDTGDGPDTAANYVLLQRGKRHDYFTSCLPWAQKGTAVTLPMVGNATVYGSGNGMLFDNSTQLGYPVENASADFQTTAATVSVGGASSGTIMTSQNKVLGMATKVRAGAIDTGLYADMTTVTAATINQLRQSFQIQKLYERDARGGTRYTEIIRSHFGVASPDARLQRPEYLGGGSTRININSVAQNSATGLTGGTTPQGNLSAFGVGTIKSHGFTKSFVEHGYIIGLVNVRADLTYQQGLARHWSRSTRWDFFWPALAQIGEQAVLNQEIMCLGTGGGASDATVFGYQERFAEYRYKPSEITGQFRSTYATPLDAWHLSDFYTAVPTLGSTWIVSNPPISRVVAAPSQPQFLFDAYFHLICARPMPLYGVPGLIDHF